MYMYLSNRSRIKLKKENILVAKLIFVNDVVYLEELCKKSLAYL